MNKNLSVFFILFGFLGFSQNWDSIPKGNFNTLLERVLTDSVHDVLLASSKFFTHVGPLPARGICSWDGSKWDSLAGGINTHNQSWNPYTPNGMALCCMPYNGKLLVGGMFSSVGGVNASSLALWDGIKWDSLPKRAFRFNPSKPALVRGFYKKNNLIYLYGIFDTICGQPAPGLATWDGLNFNPVILPTGSAYNGVSDVIEFQNDLYLSGGYFTLGSYVNEGDVLKYNGTTWTSTTGGITGLGGGVNSMVVYNNELYAAGHFLMSDGNSENNIMKWDGNQWKDVGFGASYGIIDQYSGTINNILTHHNKLWAFGCFSTVANMMTFSAAVYDGNQWCTLKDTVNHCIQWATVFRDTIYVTGSFNAAGGDPNIKYIAKLKDPNLFSSCAAVGISEEKAQLNDVKIYPSPFSNSIHIDNIKVCRIEVFDPVGNRIKYLEPESNSEVDLSSYCDGIYLVRIRDSSGFTKTQKVVKSE